MNRTFPIALLRWHALVLIKSAAHIHTYIDAWGFAMQRNKCTSLTHVSYVAIYVKLEKTCESKFEVCIYMCTYDDKSKAFIRIDMSCPLPILHPPSKFTLRLLCPFLFLSIFHHIPHSYG